MGQSAWGTGAAGLTQEAWQDFCSLSHLLFLFSPFIQDKVLKFCKPRLEAMLNGVSNSVPEKMTWLAGPGCPQARDPRPRLCALRAEPPEASCPLSRCPRKGERVVVT